MAFSGLIAQFEKELANEGSQKHEKEVGKEVETKKPTEKKEIRPPPSKANNGGGVFIIKTLHKSIKREKMKRKALKERVRMLEEGLEQTSASHAGLLDQLTDVITKKEQTKEERRQQKQNFKTQKHQISQSLQDTISKFGCYGV